MLRTNGVSVIAPVLGLTHLMISNAGPDFQSLSLALPLFMSLETLSLSGFIGKNLTLHLDELPKLHSLELVLLKPGSIRLSTTCKLHIVMSGKILSQVFQLVMDCESRFQV